MNIRKTLMLLCLVLFFSAQSYSQFIGTKGGVINISGYDLLSVNTTTTYTANSPGNIIYAGTWTVNGATILSQSLTSITVRWNQAGSHLLRYTATNTTVGYLMGQITVTVNPLNTVSTPSPPIIISETCTSAVLQRGIPPVGTTWFWQGTTINGTSTANANLTYTVTQSGRYLLRARGSDGTWSSGSSFVDVNLGTNGGSIWYADVDGDGLGDPNESKSSCSQPAGYVSNSNDLCPFTDGGGTPNGCPNSNGINNENYIYTIVPQKEVTDISQLTQNADALKEIIYYNGLGRIKQSIRIKQSPDEKDIVSHFSYDNLGRVNKKYLPYMSNTSDGSLNFNVVAQTNNYYISNYPTDISATDPNPFAEIQYDGSPLNQIKKQSAPGYDWRLGSGNEVKIDYQANAPQEVRAFRVQLDNSLTPTLILSTSNSGFYAEGALVKVITKDEEYEETVQISDILDPLPLPSKNHTSEEFLDKMGRTILKRTYADVNGVSSPHDTYFVYDDFGNLTYVLPPKAEGSNGIPSSTVLNNLCYQYQHDDLNRLVEKRLPGSQPVYLVYDRLGRLILQQNPKLRENNQWLFNKYDIFGRAVYSGIYSHGSYLNRSSMQSLVYNENNLPSELYEIKASSGSGVQSSYYTNNNFPKQNIELLTVEYYDNYNFDRQGTFDPSNTSSNYYSVGFNGNSQQIQISKNVKSLETGGKVKILGTNDWTTNVFYYDKKHRLVYTYSKNNYLKTSDIEKRILDFTGKIVESESLHTNEEDNLPTLKIIEGFEYDHAERLTKTTQKINNQEEHVISTKSYDNIGLLIKKDVGGKEGQNRLQSIDYTYNVRGWLKSINDPQSLGNDLFALKINYNTVAHGAKELFNGNISEVEWKSRKDNVLKWYVFDYDAFNRVKSAVDNSNRYSLSSINYDKNGNITSLQRRGHLNNNATSFGLMDNLQYTYESDSNKLIKVDEMFGGNSSFGFQNGSNSPIEYTYDQGGNLLRDYNKSMTSDIKYNHLHLPTEITIEGNTIRFIYDANGKKLRKIANNNTIDYAGKYVYEKIGSGMETLKFFNHDEGYVTNDNGIFYYTFQYKDHLGNVRLSYEDSDGNGLISPQNEIIEESSYYPFGLQHKVQNSSTSAGGSPLAQKFTFNDKELNDEFSLNWHDFGARNYNASLGRWMNLDPLAERYSNVTPYSFVANMPTIAIDPDGKRIIILGREGSSYVADVLGALASIAASSEEGRIMIERMINSNEDIIIGHFKKRGVLIKGNHFLGTRKTAEGVVQRFINYDPDQKSPYLDGTPRTIEGSIAHESGHVIDRMDGVESTHEDKLITTDSAANKGVAIMQDELNNVHRTNIIRAGLDQQLRTSYLDVRVMQMGISTRLIEFEDINGFPDDGLALYKLPKNMQFDYSKVSRATGGDFLRAIAYILSKRKVVKENLTQFQDNQHGTYKFLPYVNSATILENKK